MTTARVRAALDAVEDVLLGFDRDAKDLWAVLTALRGPDDFRPIIAQDGTYRPGTKATTTVPIRRAAFPRVAALAYRADGTIANFTNGGNGDFRADGVDHFSLHAIHAWNVLNPSRARAPGEEQP